VRERYELRIYGPARRAFAERLPVSVAVAVWEFCTGALCEQPHRVGRPLSGDLAGYFSARRGAYRVIYRLEDDVGVVHVVRIEHRSDVYRPR
jgi:mRNA interferase RelE/StbE